MDITMKQILIRIIKEKVSFNTVKSLRILSNVIRKTPLYDSTMINIFDRSVSWCSEKNGFEFWWECQVMLVKCLMLYYANRDNDRCKNAMRYLLRLANGYGAADSDRCIQMKRDLRLLCSKYATKYINN